LFIKELWLQQARKKSKHLKSESGNVQVRAVLKEVCIKLVKYMSLYTGMLYGVKENVN